MEREWKTVFLSIFISISFPLSFSTPLQYQSFVPTSLPQPQTLSWPSSDHKSDEYETIPVSESNFSIDLHHVDNLSPASDSTPESLFKLRLQRDGIRVEALSAIAAVAARIIRVDSGTSVTRLTRPAYVALRNAFRAGASNLKSSVNASVMTESCMKLLTTLLRSTRVTLSSDQLHMLIQFPMFVDFPSFVALSLLKPSIVQRKLVVPEIYDLVQIVAELMVQSQGEPIRKKSSQILLQFSLGYHLSEKRLQQHFDLSYEHSTGREAVLEMLHAIILKFPQKVVDAQCHTLFKHLVVSLANDDDKKVRPMSTAAIKCLAYSMSWYLGGNRILWGTAAQVLGLLVETIGKGFQAHLDRVLPVMRSIFQSPISAVTSSNQQDSSDDAVVPFWKDAYYSLVMEKIVGQFHNMFLDKELEMKISPKLLACYSPSTGDGLHNYAYQLLLPLYRVCEGFAGKVITDDLKQYAQEVSESIRDIIC